MNVSRAWIGWICWLGLGAIFLAAAFYFDPAAQSWVAENRTDAGIDFMRAVSHWGDWPSQVAVGIVGGLIAYSLGKRDWMRIFAAMVLACAVAGLLNEGLKIGAGRSRPSVESNVGWNGPTVNPKYHSFASGHTTSSAAFFVVLVCARRRLGILFLPIPLVIAFSRVYLNAHHLSDVVAGAILGISCAILVWQTLAARMKFPA